MTYVGGGLDDDTATAETTIALGHRQQLEAFHGRRDPKAVEFAWPFLSNPDRFVRYAARVAIEFQPVDSWREKALTETNPQASLEALLALVRASAADPAQRDPTATPVDRRELRGGRASPPASGGSTGTSSP